MKTETKAIPKFILASLALIIVFTSTTFSQCIELNKIKFGGDYNDFDYNYLCPAYYFNYGGDTSKKWNINNYDIDIRQAPANALTFKSKVDQEIKKYAGESFYNNIKFNGVKIIYPERLKEFIDSGAQLISLKNYHSKYFYYYDFKADTTSGYLIGVAVDSNGNILSKFNFPSKNFYIPIDKNFTYCKLISIARKTQKHIDPIDEIKFEYDDKSTRFYWLISQGLNAYKTHEGKNTINQVKIDAATLKATTNKSFLYVIY